MSSTPGTKFSLVCEVAREVESVASHSEKQSIFTKHFKRHSGEATDLFQFVRLLIPKDDARTYAMKEKSLCKVLARVFAGVAACDAALLTAHFTERGDIAATAEHAFVEAQRANHSATRGAAGGALSVAHVDAALDRLAACTKETDQAAVVGETVAHMSATELHWFTRILMHDLKINAGAKYVLNALHPEAYAAYMHNRDLKTIIGRIVTHGAFAERFEGDDDDADAGGKKKPAKKDVMQGIAMMQPVRPMLALACKSTEEVLRRSPNGAFAEIKYDGERIQIHMEKGKAFKCFSRNLKPVMEWKVSAVLPYIPLATAADSAIFDGEILLMDKKTHRPLPFGSLGVHRKNDFEDANVCVFVFDLLLLNGRSLLDAPIAERRALLEANITVVPDRIELSEKVDVAPGDDAALCKLMTRVLREGLEGLVVKDRKSVYEPGARHWLKIKKDYLVGAADSADLVVVGAWFGSGVKGGLLSVFLMACRDADTGAWHSVTKCGSGFDDATLAAMQAPMKARMTKIDQDASRLPAYLAHIASKHAPDFVAPDPRVMPVWEIMGAEFVPSKTYTSRICIRFPRCAKQRDDKDAMSATTLQELRALFDASATGEIVPGAGYKAGDDNDDDDYDAAAAAAARLKRTVSLTASPKASKPTPPSPKATVSASSKASAGVKRPAPTTAAAAASTSFVRITGDVTRPVGDGVKAVVHFGDDSGTWGERGMFRAIAARYPQARANYEAEGKPRVGDCQLVRGEGDVHVATLIAQKVTSATTSSTWCQTSFEASLQKLVTLGSISKIRSLHLANLDGRIPGIDIGQVESALDRLCVKRGLAVTFYTLGGGGGGASSSTASTSAKQHRRELDVAATTAAASSSWAGQFQFHTTAVFVSAAKANTPLVVAAVGGEAWRDRAERHLLAHGAFVTRDLDERLVVCVVQRRSESDEAARLQRSKSLGGAAPRAQLVNEDWLWDSINTGSLAATERYALT